MAFTVKEMLFDTWIPRGGRVVVRGIVRLGLTHIYTINPMYKSDN